jgi:hypothetical protein
MSWKVNGRGHEYHNREEYERALAAHEAGQAQHNLRLAQQAAVRHQARISELQGELQQAQGNIQRQIEINQRIQTEVQGVARQQERLEAIQKETDARLTAAVTEARQSIRNNAEQLRRVEAVHSQFAAETKQMFDTTRRDMATGFADAERRRAETEVRLNTQVDAVNAKVEQDRQARLQTHQDRAAQARLQMQLVVEQLATVSKDATRLDLDSKIADINLQIEEAKAQLANGNATGSLAASGNAYASTRGLVMERYKRDGQLKALANSAAERIAAIEATLALDGVERYFKVERAAALSVIARQRNRLAKGYQEYGNRFTESKMFEDVLPELEAASADMASAVPAVKAKIAERAKRFGQAIDAVASVYGEADYQEPPRPDDLKAPVTLKCVFGGGERVDITVDLDSNVSFNAYKHGSQQACEDKGARAIAALGRELGVSGQVDPTNPQQSTEQGAAAQPRWADVGERVRRVGQLS